MVENKPKNFSVEETREVNEQHPTHKTDCPYPNDLQYHLNTNNKRVCHSVFPLSFPFFSLSLSFLFLFSLSFSFDLILILFFFSFFLFGEFQVKYQRKDECDGPGPKIFFRMTLPTECLFKLIFFAARRIFFEISLFFLITVIPPSLLP